MGNTPELHAPSPSEVPKADASKEPPASAAAGGVGLAATGVAGMAGKSEGNPPASVALDITEPGRATSLAPGVGAPTPTVDMPAAVPARTTVPPLMALADNPEIAQVSQAGRLDAIGKHPFQMTEGERSQLPIIVNRDGENAIAERLLGDTGSGTDEEAAGTNPKRGKFIKVAGVVGTFGNVVFGNDNISRTRAMPEDMAAVRQQFPNAQVEELDEHPSYAGISDTQRKLREEGRLPAVGAQFGGGPSHLVEPLDSMRVKEGLSTEAATSTKATASSSDEEELPADFPHRGLLEDGGVMTAADLDGMTKKELVELDGIGDVRADEILTARKKLSKK